MSTVPNNAVPDGWERVRIGDLGEIVAGGTPSRNNVSYWNGAIPWVTPGEITRLPGKFLNNTTEGISQAGLAGSAARLLPENSIVVTTRATLCEAAITTIPLATNQGFKNIIPNTSSDPQFTYYAIKMLQREMERLASGTTFLEISRADFERITLIRPLRKDQERVATILDTLDAAIDRTESLVVKLKQVRAGLLRDLMTHGVDENGEIRALSADQNKTDWAKAKVGELFDMQLGKMLNPKARLGSTPLPYLGNRHVLWDRVNCAELEYMDFSAIERDKFRLRSGDLLVCEGGEVGRTAIWRDELEECYFQKAVHRLRPKNERILPEYMLAFMHKAAETNAFLHLTVQTSIAHLPQERLALLEVPLPPRSEQERMVAVLDASNADLMVCEAQLAKLQAVKRGLSEDLLTGRVRVPAELELA